MRLANPALRIAASSTGDLRVSLSKSQAAKAGEESGATDDENPIRGGTLTLKVDPMPADLPSQSAGPMSERFIEKPWLADFAGFVTARPEGRWLIGRSDPLRPALTPGEAAARPGSRRSTRSYGSSRRKWHVRSARTTTRLRRAVLAHLVDGGDLVADRFPQAFDRGYGTVYREAVLINASDKALQPLVAEVLRLTGRSGILASEPSSVGWL